MIFYTVCFSLFFHCALIERRPLGKKVADKLLTWSVYEFLKFCGCSRTVAVAVDNSTVMHQVRPIKAPRTPRCRSYRVPAGPEGTGGWYRHKSAVPKSEVASPRSAKRNNLATTSIQMIGWLTEAPENWQMSSLWTADFHRCSTHPRLC